MSNTVEIVIPVPSDQNYFYTYPKTLKNSMTLGSRALVPFRNRVTIGFIVGFGEQPPEGVELKSIIDIVDDKPLFDEERLDFYRWVADYYASSLGIILKIAHPGGVGTTLRRYLVLTEKGKAQDAGSESKVLETLRLGKNLTVEKLFQLVDNTGFSELNRLVKKGLIEYRYVIKELKPKYRHIIKPLERDSTKLNDLKKKMPAKGQIAEYLTGFEAVTEDDLREIFPNVKNHIAWLNKNKFVEVYKEEIFSEAKAVFVEKKKAELTESKIKKKKKANLVASPGRKAADESGIEEEDNTPPSFEDFTKAELQKVMKERSGGLNTRRY